MNDPEVLESRRRMDRELARRIESVGNIVSGLHEYELANRLWALAGKLRRRAKEENA